MPFSNKVTTRSIVFSANKDAEGQTF